MAKSNAFVSRNANAKHGAFFPISLITPAKPEDAVDPATAPAVSEKKLRNIAPELDKALESVSRLTLLASLGKEVRWDLINRVDDAVKASVTKLTSLPDEKTMARFHNLHVRKTVLENFSSKEWAKRDEKRLPRMIKQVRKHFQSLGLEADDIRARACVLIARGTEPLAILSAYCLTGGNALRTIKELIKLSGMSDIPAEGDSYKDHLHRLATENGLSEQQLMTIATMPMFKIDETAPMGVRDKPAASPTATVSAPAPVKEKQQVPTPVSIEPVSATEVPASSHPAPKPGETDAVDAVGVAITFLSTDPTVGVVDGNLVTRLGKALFQEHLDAGKTVSVQAFASELCVRYRREMADTAEKIAVQGSRRRQRQ